MCTSVSTACSSAANAIVTGANLIRSHQAQIAVVGGAECITRFHLGGFNALMILDHEQCRPFDATRAGLNLGEGAAYLVIETLDSALSRGATVLARLSGYGNACDAFHQTASSDAGDGAFLAMQKALAMARLQPADISYVNAHGTGTPNNDLSESRALQRLFGSQLPPVSSTKGMTGHTTSASGAVEAVISLLALRHQLLPVNVGWSQPMADGIAPVMNPTPTRPLEHVMCNSFGFGGNDTSLILSR
jgi:3-oxoacyl-(acyl-carrier-protein) synthase